MLQNKVLGVLSLFKGRIVSLVSVRSAEDY